MDLILPRLVLEWAVLTAVLAAPELCGQFWHAFVTLRKARG